MAAATAGAVRAAQPRRRQRAEAEATEAMAARRCDASNADSGSDMLTGLASRSQPGAGMRCSGMRPRKRSASEIRRANAVPRVFVREIETILSDLRRPFYKKINCLPDMSDRNLTFFDIFRNAIFVTLGSTIST